VLHLLTLKRTGALRELSPLSPRAAAAVSRASELVLTRAGFWLPVTAGMTADGAGAARRQQHGPRRPPQLQPPQQLLQHRAQQQPQQPQQPQQQPQQPQQEPEQQSEHELLSGLLGGGVELRVSSADLARHVLELSRQDGASRSQTRCRGREACPTPLADKGLRPPCVLSCASRQAGDGACERAVRRLRTRMCARGAAPC